MPFVRPRGPKAERVGAQAWVGYPGVKRKEPPRNMAAARPVMTGCA